MTQIPLVDLPAQHRQIAHTVEAGFARVLHDSTFVMGKDVDAFEERFAQFVGVRHCLGVASGTDALELIIRAAGIGPGDRVVVPTNTFIATALAVVRAGAVPALVDCDANHLIDVDQVASRLREGAKAIMPVHLYGQMAPMEDLESLARRYDVPILEDAAQSQGARQHGRAAGTFGLAAGTSFYPGKNLGAYGDAGAVLTDEDAIASKVSALRNYGSHRKYDHPELGFNSRLDTLQAVVLNAKLDLLASWNELRREAAERYEKLLEPLDWVGRPATVPGNVHVWHLYVIRVPRRDQVLARLHAAEIGAGIHYPVPVHLSGAFASLGHQLGSFPVAERLKDEILSLPLFPGITAAQQECVVRELAGSLD